MNRDYFERQAEALHIECAWRKAIRQEERRRGEKLAKRLAKRAARASEADMLSSHDRALIKKLAKTLSVNELAKKWETDLVTIAVIIEDAG